MIFTDASKMLSLLNQCFEFQNIFEIFDVKYTTAAKSLLLGNRGGTTAELMSNYILLSIIFRAR